MSFILMRGSCPVCLPAQETTLTSYPRACNWEQLVEENHRTGWVGRDLKDLDLKILVLQSDQNPVLINQVFTLQYASPFL